MMEEFQFATYEGDWVASQYCPATEADVDDILARLRKRTAPAYTEQGKFRLSSWPHPSNELPEGAYHKLFAQLLNQIVEAFAECFPEAYDSSTFCDTKFFPYDRSMADTNVSGEYPLKPKILLLQEDVAKGENASWQEVFLAVEIKGIWSDLIWQAATYARSLFAASDHRCFVPILALNYKTGESRLCFFHRSGLLATHAMQFTATMDGFRDFVATIVGMLFWDREVPQQAGFVPEQSATRFSLNIPISISTTFYVAVRKFADEQLLFMWSNAISSPRGAT
ncbi:hypothetical protein HGRIS_010090 [Hohenbuehelia grisea]|uniref:Fungal-type protein kinase domain-containing protein n=1 Tax=Hohenbuehelia grisea TaxID=104357 RepID=A0ABR3J370_9AGAR